MKNEMRTVAFCDTLSELVALSPASSLITTLKSHLAENRPVPSPLDSACRIVLSVVDVLRSLIPTELDRE